MRTENIHAFTARALVEYNSIFPTVANVLDQLLFVIGNGFYFDKESGMIIDSSRKRIDEYPKANKRSWDALIKKCHAKEQGWYEQRMAMAQELNDDRITAKMVALHEERLASYLPRTVIAEEFTEEALYRQISRKAEHFNDRDPGYGARPYPLSEDYSIIFQLNKHTSTWFLEIALNHVNAWARFLNDELLSDRVWKYNPKNSEEKDNWASDRATQQTIQQLGTLNTKISLLLKGE